MTMTTTTMSSHHEELLRDIEKQMQKVMLLNYDCHYNQHHDFGEALVFANKLSNKWYIHQLEMHPGLQEHVQNARPFDKVDYFKRFEKVDATIDYKKYEMTNDLIQRRRASNMSWEQAAKWVEWHGNKYYKVKERLAHQMLFEEKHYKITKIVAIVLVVGFFTFVLFLVYYIWYIYTCFQTDLAQSAASVVVMQSFHQDEIRHLQAQAFTMEQAIFAAEAHGDFMVEQLHLSLTTRHDQEMTLRVQQHAQAWQERETEFAALMVVVYSQLDKQAQDFQQAFTQDEIQFTAQLDQVQRQIASARQEKVNLRTAAEALAERMQVQVMKQQQALFEQAWIQQSTRHFQEMESLRREFQHDDELYESSCQEEEEDQVSSTTALLDDTTAAVLSQQEVLVDDLTHIDDNDISPFLLNLTNMAVGYFDTFQRLQDTAVCTTTVPSSFALLAEQVHLVQQEQTPAHLNEKRGIEFYNLMQEFQPVKEEEKPCTRLDLRCRLQKSRQEERLAIKPCDFDDFWCRFKADLWMDSPHEYSQSALRKELEVLRQGKYSEFSWQSIYHYSKIQQYNLPGLFAKQYHPQDEEHLQQQHEELMGLVGFVMEHESLFLEPAAAPADVVVHGHVEHEYISLPSSTVLQVVKEQPTSTDMAVYFAAHNHSSHCLSCSVTSRYSVAS